MSNPNYSNSAVDWQREIYLNGFIGKKPTIQISFDALELSAKNKLSTKSFAYIAGEAKESPKSEMLVSRVSMFRSILGTILQRSKSAWFECMVFSVPAPPAI